MSLKVAEHEAVACGRQERAANTNDPFLIAGQQLLCPLRLGLTIVIEKRDNGSRGGIYA